MLLLHQSAIIYLNILYISNIAPEGFEPSYVMMKTLCLNHLTIGPKKFLFLKSSASIALASAGYKTATLLLC
jgi:hypothetical protein